MLHLLVLWIAIAPGQGHAPEELRQAVGEYFSYLQKEDIASAISYIHPEDLNYFLKRRRLPVVSWSWVSHQPLSETSYSVEVDITREFQMNPFEVRETLNWEKTSAGWKLRVEDPQEVQQRLLKTPRNLPPEIRVLPSRIRFYKDANLNRASLTVQNGLSQAVEIVAVELDEKRFRVIKSPSVVAPSDSERILLEYVGQEAEANLTSAGELRLRVEDGAVEVFPLEIDYNFDSGTLRWVRKKMSESEIEAPPGAPVPPLPDKPPTEPRPPAR